MLDYLSIYKRFWKIISSDSWFKSFEKVIIYCRLWITVNRTDEFFASFSPNGYKPTVFLQWEFCWFLQKGGVRPRDDRSQPQRWKADKSTATFDEVTYLLSQGWSRTDTLQEMIPLCSPQSLENRHFWHWFYATRHRAQYRGGKIKCTEMKTQRVCCVL